MVETARYEVAGGIGEIELREYPELMPATVTGQQDNAAFRLLFSYISGENRTRKKMPMTAPVITSEKIEMIAPVISDANSFSFVLPLNCKLEEIPEPLDFQAIGAVSKQFKLIEESTLLLCIDRSSTLEWASDW